MKRYTGPLILIVLLAIPVAWILLWENAEIGYERLPIYTYTEFGDTIPYTIDTFSLYDQSGRLITRDSIGDRVLVANFFFTSCPDICPTMNGNIKILTEKMKQNKAVVFLSHSVDPENDSVPVLAQYASDFSANPNQWHFLTGPKSEIHRLASESYRLVAVQKDSNAFIHSEKVVLVDKDLHIRGFYEGLNQMDIVKHLEEDIRFLLKEYKDE